MTTWEITDNQFDFTVTHRVEATRDIVYQVLSDMEAYPDFVNELVSVRRDGNLYHGVGRVALFKIPATMKVSGIPGHSLAFELVDGPVDLVTGSWLLENGETPAETQVTLTIHVESGARGEWLLRMTAKYVESKTDKFIAAFSNRAIQLARGEVPHSRSAATRTGGLKGWLQRLGARLFNRKASASTPRRGKETSENKFSAIFQNEHAIQSLEALASTILPADDFDEGVQNLGFVSVMEMRSRYEAGRQELYATALKAVDQMANSMFNQSRFIDLTPADRITLLDAIQKNNTHGGAWGEFNPSAFFSALWEDTVFLYCTHPDTHSRIGFPGPSFSTGGYRDFDQPQEFAGRQ